MTKLKETLEKSTKKLDDIKDIIENKKRDLVFASQKIDAI